MGKACGKCLGNDSGRLGEAWGGLFCPCSASLGKLGRLGAAWGGLGNAWERFGEAWGMLGNASGRFGEAWGGLGKAWGMLCECFGEAWGGLGNAWECFGEAWGGLGLSGPQPASRKDAFGALFCSFMNGPASQPAKRMTGLFYPRSVSHGIARDALGWRVHASASLESPQTRWAGDSLPVHGIA